MTFETIRGDNGRVKPGFISTVNTSSGGFVGRYLGTPSAVQKSSLMSHGLQNRLNTTCRRTTAHTITRDRVTTDGRNTSPIQQGEQRDSNRLKHRFKR